MRLYKSIETRLIAFLRWYGEIYFPNLFSIEIDEEGSVSDIFCRDDDINFSIFDELNQRVRSFYIIIGCYEFKWKVEESFKSCLGVNVFDGQC